jgi:hypothetical protein
VKCLRGVSRIDAGEGGSPQRPGEVSDLARATEWLNELTQQASRGQTAEDQIDVCGIGADENGQINAPELLKLHGKCFALKSIPGNL